MQRAIEGLFHEYCVALRVWTETEGQADAVSYESASSLLNCSSNDGLKKW